MVNNLSSLAFLTGRTPIIVPHGILPASFQPQDGSVYDSFAAGLPPVIFINGQFYPLTPEELNYLKQIYSQSVSSRGPEAMPQVPAVPLAPETIDDLRHFEQKSEQVSERSPEQAEQATADTSSQQSSPIAVTAQPMSPQPVVDIKAVLGAGYDLISQSVVEDTFAAYKRGQVLKATTSSDAAAWLRLLLMKAFAEYESDTKKE